MVDLGQKKVNICSPFFILHTILLQPSENHSIQNTL